MRRLWRRLFGPRPSDPLPPLAPVVAADWCCICLVDLQPGEVWEKRDHMQVTGEEIEGGGSWVARTYCEQHAPADAMPPLRSDR